MKNESTNRFPELDGVRGLAILLVLFLHIFAIAAPLSKNIWVVYLSTAAKVGWVGVDVFFVLSGFLITTILLNTRNHPHYFKNFYARRILRIFPLYFLVIGVVFLFLPVLMPKSPPVERESWPYFLLYVQNWLHIPSFHLAPFPLMISPSWSLAIEEQFYLIWPALVFLLSRRMLAYLSVAIFVFSLVARFFIWQFGGELFSSPQFLYFNTFTRFDGFSLGALIALAFQSPQWKQILIKFAWPVLGVSLTVFMTLIITTGTFAPGDANEYINVWGYSLIALASGALMVIVTTGSNQALLPVLFRSRVLSFFGKYSYAMYLLHFPVTLVLFDRMSDAQAKGGRDWLIFVVSTFALTILGSLVTWHLLEKQMLKLKKYFEY